MHDRVQCFTHSTLNQSTETIQQSIAKSEIQMLFNVNSYTPLYAFIPAIVSICHIVNLQLVFNNSIL